MLGLRFLRTNLRDHGGSSNSTFPKIGDRELPFYFQVVLRHFREIGDRKNPFYFSPSLSELCVTRGLKGEHRRHGHGCGPRHWSAPVGAIARADLHVHCGHIRVREITMGLRDPACLLSFLRPPGEQSLAVSRRAGFQTVLSPPSQAGGVS